MVRSVVAALILSVLHVSSLLAYEKEIENLSKELSKSIIEAQKKRVAVADFTDLRGDVSELGRFLAEELSVAIAAGSKSYQTIDRNHLRTLLAEHRLSTTGAIDPATAKALGKIASVDCLIVGNVTPLGESVRITVKMLETETAQVIHGLAATLPRTSAIEELLRQPIAHASGKIGDAPGPVSRTRHVRDDLELRVLRLLEIGERETVVTIEINNLRREDVILALHPVGRNARNTLGKLVDDDGSSYSMWESSGIDGGDSPLFIGARSKANVVLTFLGWRKPNRNLSYTLSWQVAVLDVDKDGRPKQDRNEKLITKTTVQFLVDSIPVTRRQ